MKSAPASICSLERSEMFGSWPGLHLQHRCQLPRKHILIRACIWTPARCHISCRGPSNKQPKGAAVQTGEMRRDRHRNPADDLGNIFSCVLCNCLNAMCRYFSLFQHTGASESRPCYGEQRVL